MSALPFARPLTRADLEALPDDGQPYELIDGTLIVSAAPRLDHQTAGGNLHLDLRAAYPPDLRVILALFAVALADDTEVQPDLLVAPRPVHAARPARGAAARRRGGLPAHPARRRLLRRGRLGAGRGGCRGRAAVPGAARTGRAAQLRSSATSQQTA